MHGDCVLRVQGVAGGYAGRKVVRDVSFSLHAGECLGIIGPNGAGKSTLLRLASKALALSAGSVRFFDCEIAAMNLAAFARQAAFVSQATQIAFSYKVMDIVLLGRIAHASRWSSLRRHDRAAAEKALELVGLRDFSGRFFDELSAGERQLVCIAKALAQEPKLLFLDEPTAHLDIGHAARVLGLMRQLTRQHQLAVVAVLHDLNAAGQYCDRIMLLHNGCVVSCGIPVEVLTQTAIEGIYDTPVLVQIDGAGIPFVRMQNQASTKE